MVAAAQQGASGRNKSADDSEEQLHKMLLGQDLPPRQMRSMELLLRGHPDTDVAAELDVGCGTVCRWRKDPDVAARLHQIRQELWSASLNQLQHRLRPALKVIQSQIASDDPRTALRTSATMPRIFLPERLKRLAGDEDQTRADEIEAAEKRDLAALRRRRIEQERYPNEVLTYVKAPLPGQPGHPQTVEAPEDQNLDGDDDDPEEDDD